MTTLGGRILCRTGVLPPFGADDPPGNEPNLSACPDCEASPPSWGGWPATPWSPPGPPALFGGRGLLRISLSVEVDEDGVRTGDWLASRPELEGDEVPSLPSLFFLEALFGSFPRESYTEAKHVSRA
jgi:hypothetical protein